MISTSTSTYYDNDDDSDDNNNNNNNKNNNNINKNSKNKIQQSNMISIKKIKRALLSSELALQECKLLWKKGLSNAAKGNLTIHVFDKLKPFVTIENINR